MKVIFNKQIIFVCLCLLIGNRLFGQSATLKGTVKEKTGIPMLGVTVKIFKETDTTAVNSVMTDQAGGYVIGNLLPGNYHLTFSFIGFADGKRFLRLDNGATVTLQPLVLQELAKNLHEVAIRGLKNPVSINKGKLTYNVEQSATATGSSVLELLRKTPGVSVDQNGSLVLKGSAAVNVMIDGKMTYLSQQQLSQLLDGMSSGNISKIEIIATPSAQFDASGNAGIINIVTRKSVKPGYAANISAGATLSRYLLHTENFTGNIRTKKFNVFGNFGYAYRRRFLLETSTQLTTDENGNMVTLNRNRLNPNQSNFYNYKAGLDFYASAKNQFGFSYTGTTDDWSKDANGKIFVKAPSGAALSTIVSRNVAKEPFYNNIFNLNYQYKIDTMGKTLTADADYIAYRNYSDGFLNSNSYLPNGIPLEPFQQLNFHQPSIINIRSLKADLDLPFKKINIKAGLKYADVSTNNNFRYDSLINNQLIYAPSLSDHFKYSERIAAAYLSAAKKWQQTDVEAGLRVEHTYANANSIRSGVQRIYDYTNFFPSFSIGQVLDEHNKLDFSVSRRINRPVYTDLNPVRYYADKFSLYQGNPNLIAETAWLTMLSLIINDKYIASISYSHADNFIARSAIVDPATKILTLSSGNYDYRNRWEAQVIAPFTITSWWEINSTATLSYSAYPVAQLEGPKKVQKITVDLFAGQTYRLPAGITAELQARYTSPELNGIYMNKYYFTMDGGAKKSFLNHKLDARFAFADLFQTGWFWGYSLSNTLHYQYKNTPDSRRFSLMLIYHLGGKLNTGKSHRTEEQNRL